MALQGERADRSDRDLVAHAEARLADDAATAERVHVEWAATSWRSLLHDPTQVVEVAVANGATVVGAIADVGTGWCLVTVEAGQVLVMLDKVVSVSGVGSATSPSEVQRGVGWVLRRWARMQVPIAVQVVSREVLRGRIHAVLADAVTLLTETEQPQRRVIPLAAVVTVKGPAFPLDD